MRKPRYFMNGRSLALDAIACMGCGACVEVCPHAVFRVADGKAAIADREACMECGACAKNCPAGAIAVESGVGCAAAVIAGKIRGGSPTCDCGCGGDEVKPGAPPCC